MERSIPKYGTVEYWHYAYKRKLEANRGHNFEYWNEGKHGKLLEQGYSLYKFKDNFATSSELGAKEVVQKLRQEGNHARIVAGYDKNIQRIKMFSVIYKKK